MIYAKGIGTTHADVIGFKPKGLPIGCWALAGIIVKACKGVKKPI